MGLGRCPRDEPSLGRGWSLRYRLEQPRVRGGEPQAPGEVRPGSWRHGQGCRTGCWLHV